MKFYSTNKSSKLVSVERALLDGQAPDGGLYLPGVIPKFSPRKIASMSEMQYPDIALEVLHPFLEESMPRGDLEDIVSEAYRDFPIPLEHVDDGKYLMRQDRGPTASFKDFAGVLIGRLMSYYTENDVSVVITYPQDEVSAMQRKQMTTLGGNVRAIAVEGGKFDDCQAMNKRAFSDPELKHLNLSSANSINIGRLLPQACYYFYAYSQLCEGDENFVVSVPCGNFGNLTAGLIAKRMGLPVSKFIAAVNENDVFQKFLYTGIYEPIVPSKNCISSAMNVGNLSNGM
ncbi:MAG: threonine synthase, partial [Candidatus Aenigmarchaeota archaeon]|nr:threonine synthase [Candidatus Aenigmarchaeota archaeon]